MHLLNGSRREYRADIDGIRALAVLSVFFFHLRPELLPGGFLGVDVFFIISGYLITSIILRENYLQTFSFSNFYARRVKRIFPALFVVLGLSAVIATFLLTPETYVNYMVSARYASGQLANFFFSQKVDYFSEGFSEQPLLHTWSLGVEEQFYLFWPLLIFLCFWFFKTISGVQVGGKRYFPGEIAVKNGLHHTEVTGAQVEEQRIARRIGGVFLLLSLGSYIWCSLLAETNHNTAFYMFYTRAWEFCIGGFISLKIVSEPVTKTANNLTGALGLLLLSCSFLFVKEEFLGLSFLQFGVIVPCIGTALIIYSDWQTGIINRLLSTKIPVYIGKISYSLYLYHWPVIIFYKLYSNEHELGLTASLAIILVSFILATLSYLLIEQPARKTRVADRRVLTSAVSVIIVFAVSFNTLEEHDSASWRITRYAVEKAHAPRVHPPGCSQQSKGELQFYECKVAQDDDAPYVALVGDSHSPHFLQSTVAWAEKNGYNVLYLGSPGNPFLLGDVRVGSRIDERIEIQSKLTLPFFASEIVNNPKVELILLAQRFDLLYDGKGFQNSKHMLFFKDSRGQIISDHTNYYRDQLAYTVDTIRKAGKELVILKQVPILKNDKDCAWEPRIKKILSKERACEYDRAFIEKWQRPSIDFMDDFAATHQVAVFDPMPYFDEPMQDGITIYLNKDHLNAYGGQLIVPHFIKGMDKIMALKGNKTEKLP